MAIKAFCDNCGKDCGQVPFDRTPEVVSLEGDTYKLRYSVSLQRRFSLGSRDEQQPVVACSKACAKALARKRGESPEMAKIEGSIVAQLEKES